jgi:hypothetical protein
MEYKSRHGHASIERLYKGEREEIDLHETRTVATVSVRDVMLTTLRIVHAHKRCVCRLRGGESIFWYEVESAQRCGVFKMC